jgi:hypothetical protein
MQKSTTVFSVPLAELDDQLCDVASWPAFLPELEAVTEVARGRYLFRVRGAGGVREMNVAVRRSPFGSGMIWTVVDGPAWNGHLYLQVVDGRRTRVHLELRIEPHSPEGYLPEAGDPTHAQLGLVRLQDTIGRGGDGERVVQIPA